MRAAPFLLATIMLAAGCLSNAPAALQQGSTKIPSAADVGLTGLFHGANGTILAMPAGAVRALGGEYRTGASATEPTIGVTPKGTVFMTGFGKLPVPGESQPALLRSKDKGQTWETVAPPLQLRTNDPIVFVDPDTGRVYQSDIMPLSCTFLSWSDDEGATWTTNPYACGNSDVNDHQTIVTAKPRMLPVSPLYPKIVYSCVNNVAYFACATSLDGGLTFGPQIPVDKGVDPNEKTPLCSSQVSHLKAGPDGKVYMPKTDCSVQVSKPVVYITDNDGLTWTKHVIADVDAGPHDLGFAIDEKNDLYATWVGPGDDGHQYYAYSTDGGDTWSKPIDITAPGVTATMFTTAATGVVGKLSFAYIGSTVEGGYANKSKGNAGLVGDVLGQPAAPDWANATWNAYIGVMTDALTDHPTIQTVTANDPKDPVARHLCGQTRCHGMNDFIDMVVDGEGRPWVAFVDVCNEKCVADPKADFDTALGFAGTLRQGPALLANATMLAPLAPPPAKLS